MKYRVAFDREEAMWKIQSSRFGIIWLQVGKHLWYSKEDCQGAINILMTGKTYRKEKD